VLWMAAYPKFGRHHYSADVMQRLARRPLPTCDLPNGLRALLCKRRRLSLRRLVAWLGPFRPAGIGFHILFGG
jgi:hypothetical protein